MRRALIDGAGKDRAGIVLARLVLLERADELPVAPVEEPGHRLALGLDPERLLCGRGPVVGDERSGGHAITPVSMLMTISNGPAHLLGWRLAEADWSLR